ncbi:hypothetical protein [Pseudoxanthomonas sacheonensis]|uniref:hypothetical protein n=1 Tax=Pseudoxanthomonas sacheonensis TaxID=443615 RepID=UPI0013D56591|nr:hypothetical protein [Pseudoxanthomonas sacheonensis]
MKMIEFCELVFKQAYLLSGRFSGGQEPSLFRACLFVSAALFINTLTVLFALEALLGIVVNLSKVAFVATSFMLLVGCSVFVLIRKDSILLGTEKLGTPKSLAIKVYFFTSLILFGVSAVLLYRV